MKEMRNRKHTVSPKWCHYCEDANTYNKILNVNVEFNHSGVIEGYVIDINLSEFDMIPSDGASTGIIYRISSIKMTDNMIYNYMMMCDSIDLDGLEKINSILLFVYYDNKDIYNECSRLNFSSESISCYKLLLWYLIKDCDICEHGGLFSMYNSIGAELYIQDLPIAHHHFRWVKRGEMLFGVFLRNFICHLAKRMYVACCIVATYKNGSQLPIGIGSSIDTFVESAKKKLSRHKRNKLPENRSLLCSVSSVDRRSRCLVDPGGSIKIKF